MIQGPGQLGACLPLWTELGDGAHLQQSQEPELVTGPLAQPLQGSTVQHELGTARRFRSGLPLFHSLRPVIAEGKGAVGVPAWRARRADSMCPEASLADRFLCSATMVPTRPSASNRSRLGREPFIPEPTSATVISPPNRGWPPPPTIPAADRGPSAGHATQPGRTAPPCRPAGGAPSTTTVPEGRRRAGTARLPGSNHLWRVPG